MKKCFRLFIALGCLIGILGAAWAKDTTPASPATCEKLVSATLCQKIGQLLIVGSGGYKQDQQGKVIWNDPNGLVFKENSNIARAIADWHVGGIILLRNLYRDNQTGQLIRDRNIQSEQQVSALTHALQAYNEKIRRQQHLPTLPLLISMDQEGGMVSSEAVSDLPNYIPQALGKDQEMRQSDQQQLSRSMAFTRQYALKIAQRLHKIGINLNFAPDVDVNVNPVNPIIGGLGRSFSANPDIVTAQAAQIIDAYHQEKVLATLKHFPGHGSSSGDTHKNLVDVTQSYQMDQELVPYKNLIGHGFQDFVMSTHVINGQLDRSSCLSGNAEQAQNWCPGTMSYKTLTELLRKQLHFQGVIVSDDMAMKAIADHYSLATALEKALNAGVDMFIVSNHDGDYTGQFVNTIAQLVHDGKLKPSQIEDAYQRIVAIKQRI